MPSLAPLVLPPLQSTSEASTAVITSMLVLVRIEALSEVILRMLRTPTERVVPVPISAIVGLVQAMLQLTSASNVCPAV